MAMVVKRRADRLAEAAIIKKAQVKKARRSDTSDFEIAAKIFTDAAKAIRVKMKELGSDAYEHFHAGFEECAALRLDPIFVGSQEAQYLYGNLEGADRWLLHEADKLGQSYVSPAHFYKAWELAGEPLI